MKIISELHQSQGSGSQRGYKRENKKIKLPYYVGAVLSVDQMDLHRLTFEGKIGNPWVNHVLQGQLKNLIGCSKMTPFE